MRRSQSRYRWMIDARECDVGCPTAKLTLMVLASYADYDGECWPPLAEIAYATGQSMRQAHRTLNILAAGGWIEIYEDDYGIAPEASRRRLSRPRLYALTVPQHQTREYSMTDTDELKKAEADQASLRVDLTPQKFGGSYARGVTLSASYPDKEGTDESGQTRGIEPLETSQQTPSGQSLLAGTTLEAGSPPTEHPNTDNPQHPTLDESTTEKPSAVILPFRKPTSGKLRWG